jgi:hypothetical protein
MQPNLAHLFVALLAVLLGWGTGTAGSAASTPANDAAALIVDVYPNPVINGNVLALLIDTRSLNRPIVGIQAKLDAKIIPVFEHPLMAQGLYVGLVGISYYSDAGPYHIKLEWTDRTGYHHQLMPFEIRQGRYRSENLHVPARKVTPAQSDMDRVNREKEALKAIYALSSPRRLWHDTFQLPVSGKITSPYGSRRLYNGKITRYHSGVDFRAPTGTPIHATNTGIVRMAKNLFFSGNHVIVDHGKGLFTGYSHLSQFSVTPGQLIRRGDLIGLAGASGRANGPHLHWGAKLNGVNINPLQLPEISDIVLSFREYGAPITVGQD